VLDTLEYFYTNASGVYDKAGRLQREVDAGGRTHAFTYSNYNELSAETHPDLGTGQNYYFDQNRNRTRRLLNGANTYAGYDGQNKLLWANATNTAPTSNQANPYRKYTYDSSGQPISIEHRDAVGQPVKTELLDWDGMGKLRRIRDNATGTVLYSASYDGGGDRVTQTQGGVTHTLSYGAGLLRDDTGTGSTTYTPGISQRAGLADTFFHEDWLGSNRYLTDATGLTVATARRFKGYRERCRAAGPRSLRSNRVYFRVPTTTSPAPITLPFTSRSPDTTRSLAEKIGRRLDAGDVVTLSGDLGAGKTLFAQGLADGLDVEEPVSSPTFALVHEYRGRVPVWHLDTYRVHSLDELIDLSWQDLLAGHGVVIVEWPERIAGALPPERLDVRLAYVDPDTRRVELLGRGERMARLVRAVATAGNQDARPGA
jgi:tRNA threonylcarbamoyladenosine biosynthesis protein TsaE